MSYEFKRPTKNGESEIVTIVGKSKQMWEIFDQIDRLKNFDFPVLITGETGTGKRLVTEALHYSGKRSKKEYLSINCGAIQESVLANELFGHLKGAYTEADRTTKGFFDVCNGGTLNLDEITMLSPRVQSTFLTIVEQGYFNKIGGPKKVYVDVRVIASTNNADITELRQDLYQRLSTVVIRVPPLRERRGDIPLLIQYYMDYFQKFYSKPVKPFSRKEIDRFVSADWPGNVRELEHAIERIICLDCPRELTVNNNGNTTNNGGSAVYLVEGNLTLRELEKEHVLRVLEQQGGNKTISAKILGIDLSTLHRRLNKWRKEELLKEAQVS